MERTPSILERRPRRVEGVECLESDDGFLVHDLGRDRVHHLNPTAAALLELADGRRTGHEVAALVGQLFALPAPPTAEVGRCLEQLEREGLVVVE